MKYIFYLISSFIIFSVTAAPETIYVIPPYEIPPYIINFQQQKGLVFDLVKKLNQRNKNKFLFVVKPIPRARALQMLEDSSEPVIISYISPNWIDEKKVHDYLWSHVLLEDSNVIIYRPKKQIKKLNKLSDLNGLRTSLVIGMKNQIYEDLKNKVPLIIDTSLSIDSTFKKLNAGRIDFFITGLSIANYYKSLSEFKDLKLDEHLMPNKFDRQLLIHPKVRTDILKAVNQSIASK